MFNNTTYLLDDFVVTRPGRPFRLFKFGKLIKGGIERLITPEFAAKFKLPHFKPAIKLGSHDETTPAGGHIVELLVKDDGLYAVPEWNEQGLKAIEDGAYRYQSPEVIWEEGALENPDTGKDITGPLIIGDALMHLPHLGESVSLYGVEPLQKELETMTVETVQIPKNFWDSVVSKFTAQPEEPEPVIVAETDEFKAAVQERDTFKAELDGLKAQAERDELNSVIVNDLQDKENYGAVFVEKDAAQEAAEMLAGMDKSQREWVSHMFKSFIAQIDESALTAEKGSNQEADADPAKAFNAAVTAIRKDKSVSYNDALAIARTEHSDLFEAYQKAQ